MLIKQQNIARKWEKKKAFSSKVRVRTINTRNCKIVLPVCAKIANYKANIKFSAFLSA
ncbi:hypothetical protein ACFGVR_20095 [Mucilaginibacter sp. AW1-3]